METLREPGGNHGRDSRKPKVEVGFQATLHVRNRMVQAYTDIMNMQV